MISYFVETYGCQMNKADSSGICELLNSHGYKQVNTDNEADLVIINTCSVRKTAENRIWGRLGYYKSIKRQRDLVLLITGCMAQRVGEDFFLSNTVVDIVVGNFQKEKIPLILKNYHKGDRVAFLEEKDIIFSNAMPDKENPRKAFVTISHGCNNYCSYCIVPYLRGSERSRNSDEIITDINNLVDQGVVQVTLLGQNVNSYGLDKNDINFVGLLKRICRETDIKWIKYLSSHPKDFTDELIETIAEEDKISNWIHLAVQAGSNHILELMNRKYTIESFIEKVERVRALIPRAKITTDIIVGFPGESHDDYLKTVDLVEHVRFDEAYMYKYNDRENTVANLKLTDDVPAEEKTERLSRIIDIQRDICRERKLDRINDYFEVLPERWSKNSDNQILGLTRDDFMIVFKGEQQDFSKVLKVKAVGLEGNTLVGEKIT